MWSYCYNVDIMTNHRMVMNIYMLYISLALYLVLVVEDSYTMHELQKHILLTLFCSVFRLWKGYVDQVSMQ